MHAMKVMFYLSRLVVYRLLGMMRFFSKPGSRVIVPVGVIGAALLLRPELHEAGRQLAAQMQRPFRPEPVELDAVLALVVVVAICAYVLASRALAVLLGAFPVAKRPLPPVRRLKATRQHIRPTVVRVVVPALPRRR